MPGMRRSKFLLPHTLAGTVFGATRLPLAHHPSRPRAVGRGLVPAPHPPILPPPPPCPSAAPHDGARICVPAENPCSHRWLYSAAPEERRAPPRARHQRRRHALHFLALHMHATAAGELLMLRSFSFPLAAPAARKPPVRDPRCPCCPSRRPAHV